MGPDLASWITIILHCERRIRTWSKGEEVRGIYNKVSWTILFSSAVVRESEVKKSLGNYIWYGGFWEDQWARAGIGPILLSYFWGKNKVMDLRPLEVKPLKGQLTGSIKTKIPELVRRRQTLQREHFILKPKEGAIWARKDTSLNPHTRWPFWKSWAGPGRGNGNRDRQYLTEFISMSLNFVSFASVLFSMGSFLVRTFRVMSIRLVTLMWACM